MNNQLKFKQWFALLLFCYSTSIISQTIKGKVEDIDGNGFPFVDVIVKGTFNGTETDENGKFTLNVSKLPTVLVFSSVGYKTEEKTVSKISDIRIILEEDRGILDKIVITGNRSKPRTILDSPVPIDNIASHELQMTGKSSIDQMLTYASPSYNSTNHAVSDATSHFDPADLRGLGPSRTLVLINGKRKNQSALVYVNDTAGKGEVGTDMKSIPTAAIERIEILRDGASAQYGSDAVAGVVNIILKKNINTSKVNINSGITSKGDGFNADIDVNHTLSFANGSFINAALGVGHQDATNRAGTPGRDSLYGIRYVDGEYPIEAADGYFATDGVLATGADILYGNTDWLKANPDLGMTIGLPEMTKGDIYLNSEFPLNDNSKIYAFGGFNLRKGKSFMIYRAPYWPEIPGQNSPQDNALFNGDGFYQGFQPTFETGIKDILFTTGSEFLIAGFNADLSATFGSNKVDYTVNNTINPTLKSSSPTKFNAGAYSFSNFIGNFDINRTFGELSMAFGIEARQERFKVSEGQPESYAGKGALSFPGLQPSNALNETRTNIGLYGTLDWDISDTFLIGGAVRHENYSDFGGNTSWKINSRYKIGEAGVIRGAYSTGFRAPSLHQVYLSNIQAIVSGSSVSSQGTFNNESHVIQDLGVAPLFAETSENISAGLTVKASRDFTISLDYYNVKVNDRVLFSGEIDDFDDNGVANPVIEKILDDNNVQSIKFFINALNTITHGLDYTMRYKNIDFASGNLGVNLALNVNKTNLDGEVETPTKLSGYKNEIFNRKEQSKTTSARPNMKFLFGGDYRIGSFSANLNNTYFGEITWQHPFASTKDQTFTGKVITDLSIGYDLSTMIAFRAQVNNLFNVYPDEIDPKGDPKTNVGGRFRYPFEISQFGFNGTSFRAGLTFKF